MFVKTFYDPSKRIQHESIIFFLRTLRLAHALQLAQHFFNRDLAGKIRVHIYSRSIIRSHRARILEWTLGLRKQNF